MIHKPPTTARPAPFTLLQIVSVLALAALLTLAVTRQSLWIDEAAVAWFASLPTLASMTSNLVQGHGSDPQMPLYLVYMRAWVHLFGDSEVALRLSNLPFAVILLASLSWISRVLLGRPVAWMLFALSPFLWFYMNEARPYVALMTACMVVSGAVLAYCLKHEDYGRGAAWVAMSAFLLAFGLHMLAAFVVFPLIIFILLTRRGNRSRLLRDWRYPALVMLPAIAMEGGYYLWTMTQGDGGTRAATGIKNVLFVLYEFAGLDGLGPPRNQLRVAAGSQLMAYLPWLLLGIVACCAVLLLILRSKSERPARAFWGALFAGFILAVLACHAAHFRFVGRHLAMYCPLAFIGILMATSSPAAKRRRLLGASALALLAVAWAVSDFRMVELPAYGKDDYRAAAAAAISRSKATGGQIVWVADDAAASYYGILGTGTSAHGPAQASLDDRWTVRRKALLAPNWDRQQVCAYVSREKVPLVLVLGKPDLYDETGAWSALVNQRTARTQPFSTPNTFAIYQLSSQEAALATETGGYCSPSGGERASR